MMKAAGSTPNPTASIPPLRLVLVGAAAADAAAGVEDAASRLAALIGVSALPPLVAVSTDGSDVAVDLLMAELSGRGGSWLVPLPQDPGRLQPWGGRWSELLGAWRQPTVLLIEAPQADAGLPAACTALLQCCGVPLLGLIQWGGLFDREARRRDGLPWLGVLAQGDSADADADLALCLRRRWSQIAAEAN
ncbi:hypothetical protein WH5701_10255 [Synechococcus sp. WH 5701]|nr:hypothetical protein WH5701_10255 [Synechococcus sp. WH 5701]